MEEEYLNMLAEDVDDFLAAVSASFQLADTAASDPALERITTLGEFENWVLSQLTFNEAASCVQQRAFFRLRSLLPQAAALRVETPLSSLFPWRQRWRQWAALQNTARQLELVVPALEPPGWSMLVGLGALFIGFGQLFFHAAAGLLTLAGAVGWFWVFVRLAWALPAATVGELCRSVVQRNYTALKPRQAHRQEAIQVVRSILAEHSGIELQRLHPTLRFA